MQGGVRVISVSSNSFVPYPSDDTGDEVAVGSSRTYQLYTTRNSALRVALETCRGQSKLLFCDSSCTDPFSPTVAGGAREGPIISLDDSSATESTYYVRVEGVSSSSQLSASFQLKLYSGSAATTAASFGPNGDVATVSVESATSVTVSWPSSTESLIYSVYRIPSSFVTDDVILDTPCGMDLYSPHESEGPFVPSTAGATSYTFDDGAFLAGVEYYFVVFVSKPSGESFAYPTLSATVSESNSSSSGGVSTTVGVVIALLVVKRMGSKKALKQGWQ